MSRKWKTLRAVVEVRVPEGVMTEANLVHSICFSVHDIESRLRKYGTMSGPYVKQFNRVAPKLNVEPVAKKPDVEWCNKKLHDATTRLTEGSNDAAINDVIDVLNEMLNPS